MNEPPVEIKALTNEGVLKVGWRDGRTARLPFKRLRCACTCAACVHEFTGERLLDPDTVSEEIKVQRLELVGAYALRIVWSDGHDTGLYTWERLATLDPAGSGGGQTAAS